MLSLPACKNARAELINFLLTIYIYIYTEQKKKKHNNHIPLNIVQTMIQSEIIAFLAHLSRQAHKVSL